MSIKHLCFTHVSLYYFLLRKSNLIRNLTNKKKQQRREKREGKKERGRVELSRAGIGAWRFGEENHSLR